MIQITSSEAASTLPTSSCTLLGMEHYELAARLRLGSAVAKARRAAGYADTKEWAKAISRSTRIALGVERGEQVGDKTYEKIDRALGWLDGTCFRILAGMDVDEAIGSLGGRRIITHVPEEGDYVRAPGATVESGITNEDLLREILRTRAEYDQLRAEVRENHAAVSKRLDRLEKPDA